MAKDSKSLIQRLDGIEKTVAIAMAELFKPEGKLNMRDVAREIYGLAHGLCPNCGADMEAWEHDFGDEPCCKGAK